MKRFISSILCIILILSCFSVCVSATGEGTIAASTAKAKPGDTVNIQVSISNNPGVMILGLDVGYDSSVMKLTKVTDGALLGTATHTENLELNPYRLTWDNPTVTTDFTQNGVIATLTFLINNDASQGSYPVSLSYEKDNSEIMNVNMDDVDFVLENGVIEIEDGHTHTSVTIPGTAATCTEDGMTDGEKCSECGKILKKQEIIPAAGHKWDEGKVTKAPTCTGEGVKQFTCTVCDEKKTESVASLGHDWAVDFTIDKEPTAAAPGEKSIHCSRCDARKDITEIEKIHTHTSVTIPGKAATCTEEGMTDGEKCSGCGEILKKQEIIPATGHKWDEGKVTKAPTCTEEGVKQFICTVCDEKKTESVESLGHDWAADFTIDKEPTFTMPGEKSVHCSRCDERKDIAEIPIKILYGDVYKDGKVDGRDATRLLQYFAKWDVEINEEAADCWPDGKIDGRDATRILQYLAKWPVVLGSKNSYVCPVDLDAYKRQNADIYSWLEIPGSEISYPVFQHPTENEYYLRRDINGDYSVRGVLFTEAGYNGKDYNDPVTVIYGHDMQDETMFGPLQEMYSNDEGLARYQTIKIYLPDRELTYRVFACVPYSDEHILYNYDFKDADSFDRFFAGISQISSEQAIFSQISLEKTDKVLILSTCLSGNSDGRFLVCAKLV
ncbi:MAG: sortase [Clostridia bacterium]|nr:sortase [Clostridia bacterium]